METKIKILKGVDEIETTNPNYIDFFNPEDVAIMIMTLDYKYIKYEIIGYVGQILFDIDDLQDQVALRFYIDLSENIFKQGFDIHRDFEYIKELSRIDEVRRSRFDSLVDELNDLF